MQRLKCGAMFSGQFLINLTLRVPMEEFLQSATINDTVMTKNLMAYFLDHSVHITMIVIITPESRKVAVLDRQGSHK